MILNSVLDKKVENHHVEKKIRQINGSRKTQLLRTTFTLGLKRGLLVTIVCTCHKNCPKFPLNGEKRSL